jgi:hypothetical protein
LQELLKIGATGLEPATASFSTAAIVRVGSTPNGTSESSARSVDVRPKWVLLVVLPVERRFHRRDDLRLGCAVPRTWALTPSQAKVLHLPTTEVELILTIKYGLLHAALRLVAVFVNEEGSEHELERRGAGVPVDVLVADS